MRLNVDVPADGTVYDLNLQVTTPQGTAQATGRLRAPIPVPIVSLPELSGPIDSPTEITAQVAADDELSTVELSRDGMLQTTFTVEPYSVTIDPVTLEPGAHSLTFTATDVNGDAGSATLDFEVAALPSDVAFEPLLEGEISEPTTYSLNISGQTAPVEVSLSRDGAAAETLEAPYSFTIDPNVLAPGDHSVSLSVTNAGGVTSTTDASFTVPQLPAQFSISGLEAGQTVEDETSVQVDVSSSQAPVAAIRFLVNGEALDSSDGTTVLRAADLQPGASTLTVEVEDELGQVTSDSVNFTVAALAPELNISGLSSGDVLDSDRTIAVDGGGQTAITSIVVNLDGAQIVSAEAGPVQFTLFVLDMAPGDHSLSVTIRNAGGQSASADVDFSVSEAPMLTATASAAVTTAPSATATLTSTPRSTSLNTAEPQTPVSTTEATEIVEATSEQSPALDITASIEAEIALTQTAESAVEATAEEADAAATATDQAQQQATVDAAETANFVATVDAGQLTADAQATSDAAATLTAQAALDTQATADAQATDATHRRPRAWNAGDAGHATGGTVTASRCTAYTGCTRQSGDVRRAGYSGRCR